MMQEQEKRESLSPFLRLAERFEKLPESQHAIFKDEKKVSLKDGTVIVINAIRVSPASRFIDSYDVHILPPNSQDKIDIRDFDNQSFHFLINLEGGLRDIRVPDLALKVGDTEILKQQLIVPIRALWQTKIAAAKTLVDWLDTIIKEEKYAKPPISASLLR